MTLNRKTICPKIARWAVELGNYDYQIQHRNGVIMGHVDALSRCYHSEPEEGYAELTNGSIVKRSDLNDTAFLTTRSKKTYSCESISSQAPDDSSAFQELIPADENTTIDDSNCIQEEFIDIPKDMKCQVVSPAEINDLDFMIRAAQNRDKNILQLRDRLEKESVTNYQLKNGIVFRQGGTGVFQLYVPLEMEFNVIRLIHEKIGHLGIDKTYNEIRKFYWFVGLKEKVVKYIKNCIKCIMCSTLTRIREQNLHSIPKELLQKKSYHV